MDALRVLVVDDDDLVRWSLGECLKRREYDHVTAEDGPSALSILHERDFEVMITDLSMPGMDGLELVRHAREIRPFMVSILLTGLGTRSDVISALKEGLFDFIDKPVRDFEEFQATINRAGVRSRLLREREALLADLKRKNVKLEVSFAQLEDTYKKLSRQEKALEHELRQAQRLQQSLLPESLPPVGELEFFGFYQPCEMLGGDFFGVIPLGGTRLAIYLADVAGHGVGSAMVTVLLRELIHAERIHDPQGALFEKPGEALEYLNQGLIDEGFDPPWLVTMGYVVFDSATGRALCGSAGHPPPIVSSGGGEMRILPTSGPVLGLKSDCGYELAEAELGPGDSLLLYSDGLSELRGPGGEDWGSERLAEVFAGEHGRAPARIGARIEEALRKHQGSAPNADDLTFVVVGRKGPGGDGRGAEAEGSVKIVMSPHPAEEALPVLGRIAAGWDDAFCVIELQGKCTWQQGPALRDLVREARRRGTAHIAIDLKRCLSLDSTLLGLHLRLSGWAAVFNIPRAVRAQFEELGILDRLCLETGAPGPASLAIEPVETQEPEKSHEVILSAHEALVESSYENRERFGKAVELMRERGAKDGRKGGRKGGDEGE